MVWLLGIEHLRWQEAIYVAFRGNNDAPQQMGQEGSAGKHVSMISNGILKRMACHFLSFCTISSSIELRTVFKRVACFSVISVTLIYCIDHSYFRKGGTHIYVFHLLQSERAWIDVELIKSLKENLTSLKTPKQHCFPPLRYRKGKMTLIAQSVFKLFHFTTTDSIKIVKEKNPTSLKSLFFPLRFGNSKITLISIISHSDCFISLIESFHWNNHCTSDRNTRNSAGQGDSHSITEPTVLYTHEGPVLRQTSSNNHALHHRHFPFQGINI